MSERKREIKKGKLILVAIILVIIFGIIIFNVINKEGTGNKRNENKNNEDVVFNLPDVTYSDMKVTNVEMEYLADNNETMVSFIINNTTENLVQNETLTAYLINSNEETVGQTKTYIASLAPGEQYSISVILKGDLTATSQIKLQKEQSTPVTTETNADVEKNANTEVKDKEVEN